MGLTYEQREHIRAERSRRRIAELPRPTTLNQRYVSEITPAVIIALGRFEGEAQERWREILFDVVFVGMTRDDVARSHGVGRQRIDQLLQKAYAVLERTGGLDLIKEAA